MKKIFFVLFIFFNYSCSQLGIGQNSTNAWNEIDEVLALPFENMAFMWRDEYTKNLSDNLSIVFNGTQCKGADNKAINEKICLGIKKIAENPDKFFTEAKDFLPHFGRRESQTEDYNPYNEGIDIPEATAIEHYLEKSKRFIRFDHDLKEFYKEYGLDEIIETEDSVLSRLAFTLRDRIGKKDSFYYQAMIFKKLSDDSKPLADYKKEVDTKCSSFEGRVTALNSQMLKLHQEVYSSQTNEIANKKAKELNKLGDEIRLLVFDKKHKGCPSYSGKI